MIIYDYGMFKFSVCAPLVMTLYTKNEVDRAINNLKQVAEFTTVWHSADFQDDVPADDLEGQAFLNCKIIETEIDPDAPKIKLYTELKDEIIPGAQMTGQVMARLISFLKQNGNYSTVQTLDMGNCMYAAFLRGTQFKREVATMMLRRYIVMKICQFPAFFAKYLKRILAQTFGNVRRDPAEVDRLEREGKLKPDDAADERLPGPFSLVTYCQHLLQDKAWGDHIVLTIMSCVWQLKITILHAEDLCETKIRHNSHLPDADLVVVFTGGNHFMGCGE